jgi:hypothetical protein
VTAGLFAGMMMFTKAVKKPIFHAFSSQFP